MYISYTSQASSSGLPASTAAGATRRSRLGPGIDVRLSEMVNTESDDLHLSFCGGMNIATAIRLLAASL